MSSALGQAGFRIGTFIVMMSGGLLLFLDPSTAEYVLMVFTLILGLIFLIGIAIWVKMSQRRGR